MKRLYLFLELEDNKHTLVWVLFLSIYLKQEKIRNIDNRNHR